MQIALKKEWWILMSFIIIRVRNKQYFFCYWLIFALSFSTMDSGRIGTWNQKHVFQISTLWKNGPKSNKGFVHFWHIFLTWYSDQKRNHQKSSKHLCKYWTKKLLDYKPISHMITGNTYLGTHKIWIQVPDLSLNSICDGAVLNFDLTVHLQHLHISDGGGFRCNWNVMCLWHLLGSIITQKL